MIDSILVILTKVKIQNHRHSVFRIKYGMTTYRSEVDRLPV
jgi:hypothetical protein